MTIPFDINDAVCLKRRPRVDASMVSHTLDVRAGDCGKVHQLGKLGNGDDGVAVTFSMGTMWVNADDLELAAITKLRQAMGSLTDEQRQYAFNILQSEWCEFCGRKQPEFHWCQCNNDE